MDSTQNFVLNLDYDPIPQTVAQIQSDVVIHAQTWCHALLPTRVDQDEAMARTLNHTDDDPQYVEGGVYGALYLQGALEFLEARVSSTVAYNKDFMSGLQKYHPEWFDPKPKNGLEEEWIDDWKAEGEMTPDEMTQALTEKRFYGTLEEALIEAIDDLQSGRMALLFDADDAEITFVEAVPVPLFLRDEAMALTPS